MKEKGRAITTESNTEEGDLQALIDQIEEQDDMEEDIPPMLSATKLPMYVPPWKGKVRTPKDLEATKSALQTPLLLDRSTFEGPPLGRVPILKFKDWDLTDSENFLHLAIESLMKKNSEGLVIMLEH